MTQNGKNHATTNRFGYCRWVRQISHGVFLLVAFSLTVADPAGETRVQAGDVQESNRADGPTASERVCFAAESDLLKRLRTAGKFNAGAFELYATINLEDTTTPCFFWPRPGHDEFILAWADAQRGSPVYELGSFSDPQASRRQLFGSTFAPNISPDGKWLTLPLSESVDLIEIDTGRRHTAVQFTGTVSQGLIAVRAVFSGVGEQLCVASPGKPLTVVNLESGVVAEYEFNDSDFWAMTSIPNSTLVAWLDSHDKIKIVDMENGELIHEVSLGISREDVVAFNMALPDGQHLLVVSGEGSRVVDVRTGKQCIQLSHFYGASCRTPVNDVLIKTDYDLPGFRFCSIPNDETLATLINPGVEPDFDDPRSFYAATMSPDGNVVVTINRSGALQYWRLRTEDVPSSLGPWILGGFAAGIIAIAVFVVWRRRAISHSTAAE